MGNVFEWKRDVKWFIVDGNQEYIDCVFAWIRDAKKNQTNRMVFRIIGKREFGNPRWEFGKHGN